MEWLKDYFDLTRNEQRGILSLLVLMGLLLMLRLAPFQLQSKAVDRQLLNRRHAIEKLLKENSARSTGEEKASQETSSVVNPKNRVKTMVSFDPNLISSAEMSDLGFKEYQIKNIINFRNSGGKFRKKEDLKKLYTIKEKDYEKISPFILIPPMQQHGKVDGSIQLGSLRNGFQVVELNSADTVQLKNLKGIGSYFAKKIVERRDKLGGFYSVDQLVEIYNLNPDVITQNKERLRIDLTRIKKININSANFDQLKIHPYLGYKMALAIIKYRDQHGKFTAIKEISNSVLISDSVYSKIAPYFAIDD